MDNILSSMDLLTTPVKLPEKETTKSDTKTAEVKTNVIVPVPVPILKKDPVDVDRRREEEKKRREQVVKACTVEFTAPAGPLAELTADEWGAPVNSFNKNSLTLNRKPLAVLQPRGGALAQTSVMAVVEDDDDDDLPMPVSAVNDPKGDLFDDLPEPVPAVSKSRSGKLDCSAAMEDDPSWLSGSERDKTRPVGPIVSSSSPVKPVPNGRGGQQQNRYNDHQADLSDNDNEEDECDNGGGFDDHDGDDDDDIIELDSRHKQSRDVGRREPSPVVSRTPSPFLSTNRHYPEFYARKEAASTSDSVPVPVPTTLQAPEPRPVPPLPVPPPTEILGQKQTAKSDIDQRISEHFREKKLRQEEAKRRREEEKRRKVGASASCSQEDKEDSAESEIYQPSTSPLWEPSQEEKKVKLPRGKGFKDFEIDMSSSFIQELQVQAAITAKKPAEPGEPPKDLGSRLGGAGLGLFIDKVINRLKTKTPGPANGKQSGRGLYLPSMMEEEDDDEVEVLDDDDEFLNNRRPPLISPLGKKFSPKPLAPPLPNTGIGRLQPPPPRDWLPLPPPPPPPPELEPGELPSSPHQQEPPSPGRQSSYDDMSMIDVSLADFDDSMILDIVAELDDTLAEEEKLIKAKEKLAKHLLKKKFAMMSDWRSQAQLTDLGRQGQNIRKVMIMQLPGKELSAAGPAPRPPRIEDQPEPIPSPDVHNNGYGSPWEHEDYSGGAPTRFSAPPVNQTDLDHFAAEWRVRDDDEFHQRMLQREDPNPEYSSALAKLRGFKQQPPRMDSALEKLRNINKRKSELGSPISGPGPKRNRTDMFGEEPSISDVLDTFFTDGKISQLSQAEIDQNRFNAAFNIPSDGTARAWGEPARAGNKFQYSENWDSRDSQVHPSWTGSSLQRLGTSGLPGYNGADNDSHLGNLSHNGRGRAAGSVYETELHNRQTTEMEGAYLNNFLEEWRQLLGQHYSQLRNNLEDKMHRLKLTRTEPTDLGSQFNDMKLNMKVKRIVEGKPSSEEINVLSSAMVEGTLQFTCNVCTVTVLGKKNMDSHLEGKKHAAKMVDWEINGKLSRVAWAITRELGLFSFCLLPLNVSFSIVEYSSDSRMNIFSSLANSVAEPEWEWDLGLPEPEPTKKVAAPQHC